MSSDRRTFLHATAVGAVAVGTGLTAEPAQNPVNIALIGCGGMGTHHLKQLIDNPSVRVVAVCDPDSRRLAAASKIVEDKTKTAPKTTKDMRELFIDDKVQAVWIATPDHWHGPAAILAANHKKHVYVEKPCSHNIREGRLMIEAARRNNTVMQVGMQSRSTTHIIEAMKRLKDGVIGEIKVAKAWNSQRRSNIGKAKPAPAPDFIDFDLWVGPAPMVEYFPNRLHYGWHWMFDFGTGDMGNDGVHDIDIARWGLGVEGLPTRVAGLGGKYVFDDDQQFPDTQSVVFEYDRKQLIYEHRIWAPYIQEGYENGNAFYGTKGMMILGKNGGWQIYGEKNVPGESMKGSVELPRHHANFLECVRSGAKPNGDIEIGHHSAALCHLGNIVCRTSRTVRIDTKTETIIDDVESGALVKRKYREGHWAVPAKV